MCACVHPVLMAHYAGPAAPISLMLINDRKLQGPFMVGSHSHSSLITDQQLLQFGSQSSFSHAQQGKMTLWALWFGFTHHSGGQCKQSQLVLTKGLSRGTDIVLVRKFSCMWMFLMFLASTSGDPLAQTLLTPCHHTRGRIKRACKLQEKQISTTIHRS